MHTQRSALLIALLAILAGKASGAESPAYRSYHIGNSLTCGPKSKAAQVAHNAGFVEHYGICSTIPGAPIDWIWNHPEDCMDAGDVSL